MNEKRKKNSCHIMNREKLINLSLVEAKKICKICKKKIVNVRARCLCNLNWLYWGISPFATESNFTCDCLLRDREKWIYLFCCWWLKLHVTWVSKPRSINSYSTDVSASLHSRTNYRRNARRFLNVKMPLDSEFFPSE